MNQTKKLSVLLLTIFSAYTLLAQVTDPLPSTIGICQKNTIISSIAPWTSGCNYRALYSNTVTKGELDYELHKINEFIERDGTPHTILWYRSMLHQKFKDILNVSFDELDQMHWDYHKHDPSNIKTHLAYLQFLIGEKQTGRAQIALNSYCERYIKERTRNRIEHLKYFLTEQNIDLDLSVCRYKYALI